MNLKKQKKRMHACYAYEIEVSITRNYRNNEKISNFQIAIHTFIQMTEKKLNEIPIKRLGNESILMCHRATFFCCCCCCCFVVCADIRVNRARVDNNNNHNKNNNNIKALKAQQIIIGLLIQSSFLTDDTKLPDGEQFSWILFADETCCVLSIALSYQKSFSRSK